MRRATLAQIEAVEGVGPRLAQIISDFLKQPREKSTKSGRLKHRVKNAVSVGDTDGFPVV
jgi:hypothetical protein